jgi:hypothetical protein
MEAKSFCDNLGVLANRWTEVDKNPKNHKAFERAAIVMEQNEEYHKQYEPEVQALRSILFAHIPDAKLAPIKKQFAQADAPGRPAVSEPADVNLVRQYLEALTTEFSKTLQH